MAKQANGKTKSNEIPDGNRMESDAEKLVHKHLSDPNHVITEEEMRQIRIGVVSEADDPTNEAVAESEDRIADQESNNEDKTVPGAQKSTPWDLLNE